MARVRGLYVDIALGVAKLQKDVNRVNGSLRSIKGSTDFVSRQLGLMKQAALGAIGGFLAFKTAQIAINSFKNSIVGAIEEADKIGKVADKVGFTTDSLQELRFAAEQTGVETRTLDMALQRFSRRIGEVNNGQGELLQTAKQYNIETKNFDGTVRSNIDILRDFANVIRDAGSEQEQLRIAFKLFDSEGAALVNLMRQGASGIDSFRNEARKLGIVLDRDLIRNAEEANDKLNIMRRVLKTQLQSAVLDLAPDIIKLADSTIDWVSANKDLIAQDLKTIINGIGVAVKFTADQIERLTRRTNFDDAVKQISEMQNQVTGLGVTVKELFQQDFPGIAVDFSTFWTEGFVRQVGFDDAQKQAIINWANQINGFIEQNTSVQTKVEPQIAPSLSEQNKAFLAQWNADFQRAQIEQGQALIDARSDAQFDAYLRNDIAIQQFREQQTRDNEQRLLDIQERAAQTAIDIERKKQAARQALASASSQFLGALANATEEKNFELAKKFRAAQIVIDTASAVMRTYAEYGGTPAGIAAAAFVAGAGAIQLAAVLSSKPGSSQIAGTGAALPSQTSVAPPVQQTTTTTTEIHFHGPVYGDRDAIARDLVPAIEQAQSDGVRR